MKRKHARFIPSDRMTKFSAIMEAAHILFGFFLVTVMVITGAIELAKLAGI